MFYKLGRKREREHSMMSPITHQNDSKESIGDAEDYAES